MRTVIVIASLAKQPGSRARASGCHAMIATAVRAPRIA